MFNGFGESSEQALSHIVESAFGSILESLNLAAVAIGEAEDFRNDDENIIRIEEAEELESLLFRDFADLIDEDTPLLNMGVRYSDASTGTTSSQQILTTSSPQQHLENDEAGTNVCKICCDENVSNRKIVRCPKCEFETCFDCIERYYSESCDENNKIFISCMNFDCKAVWTIEFMGVHPLLRGLIGRVTRIRMIESANQREKSLIQFTQEMASVIKMRKLFIESLVQIRCKNTILASKSNVKRLCGVSTEGGEEEISKKTKSKPNLNTVTTLDSFKERLHSLFETAFDKGPLSSEGVNAIEWISFMAGNFGRAPLKNKDNKDDELFVEEVYEQEQQDYRIQKLQNKQKKYIERANFAHLLHRFVIDVPKENWFSLCANDFIETLVECVRLNFYDFDTYDRSVIRRIASSVREKNRSTNDFNDMIFSNGKLSLQPCYNCRGHMYKSSRLLDDKTVQTIIECKLCKKISCFKCRDPLRDDDYVSNHHRHHECKEENVLSVQSIEKTTKPCPGCAAPITRAEGCRHMFCSRCKQPYDWETLRPLVSTNTNPEYHAWLEEIRRQPLMPLVGDTFLSRMGRRGGIGSSVTSADAENENHNNFRDAIGEDGMTQLGRINALYILYEKSGFTILSSILIFLFGLERKIVRKAFEKIPKNYDFEALRIKFLIHEITEKYWYERVGSLEISSFVLNKIVIMLDRFLYEAIEETKKVARRFDERNDVEEEEDQRRRIEQTKRDYEIQTLNFIHSKAKEVNKSISSLLMLSGRPSDANNSEFFLNASSFKEADGKVLIPSNSSTPASSRLLERRTIAKAFEYMSFEKLYNLIQNP